MSSFCGKTTSLKTVTVAQIPSNLRNAQWMASVTSYLEELDFAHLLIVLCD